ncbi:dirigent protein 17-like [Gastrolobium bilobum]|uniref:dirigent protein 17-like n=1 Tax=Gastrolobium bilobum TaxID=150636 RepID=UPI002AB06CB8|nr:dirigent protein 17-like [Gastrolobium bilobum]XP_061366668.1 dirigent protein 17-like [Gastrolobium bilobum]
MEEKGNQQESNASAAGVYELHGEPAIVINGVPDIIPSNSTIPFRNDSTVKTHFPSDLGEWLEGREVRKWFEGSYYSGAVTEFDNENGWFRVHYEDGDSEDLDWHELEEVLLPMDVTIPLKSLAQRVVRKDKKSVQKSGKNVARSQNPPIKRRTTKGQ